jgi:hypothetical protein
MIYSNPSLHIQPTVPLRDSPAKFYNPDFFTDGILPSALLGI